MKPRDVIVVKTGTANLASVCAGLERAGANAIVVDTNDKIETAGRVVLPGVGAFDAAMQNLERKDMVSPLRDRIEAGRPTLAICLGMQLLCDRSEEGTGLPGLGLIRETVKKLPQTQRVPQMGWNQVEPIRGARLLRPGYAYFANSYCLEAIPNGWSGATSTHGVTFAAAIERGSVLACQFHPELSSDWGTELLARWLKCSEKEVRTC